MAFGDAAKNIYQESQLMTFAMAILILGTVAGIAASQGQVGWQYLGYYFVCIWLLFLLDPEEIVPTPC